MIPQLVQRLMDGVQGGGTPIPGVTRDVAAAIVLGADPFDLMLHMEEVWNAFSPWNPTLPSPASARATLLQSGAFHRYTPPVNEKAEDWDHLGYSYVLENTRAIQILRRVVREYRSGERFGSPSAPTARWLDATEALLFGAANPISPWLSTSTLRQEPEAVRRNAYWRLFGIDLAFGTDDNRAPTYDKANAANASFIRLFEELLFELWQAISNVRNTSGINASDDDRIFRLAEELAYVLRSRKKDKMLAREELAAATALGWAELTLSADTPVVLDLKANATSAADRLRLIGERVGLPAHSKTAALFAMCSDLSLFLRTIELGVVTGPDLAWLLYLTQPPSGAPATPRPIGTESRRLITEWAAATGKDLKARAKPIETSRPRLVSVQ